jgi:hypothetical protein
MANTYTWIISQLESYPEKDNRQDVVFTIHWRRQVSDELLTTAIYGSQSVTLDPNAPFTPYAELTEAAVVTWLEDAIGDEGISDLDSILDSKISMMANPQSVTLPLPWSE